MTERTDTNNLVAALRAFGEMPLEGGAVDPLIEVMNSLAHQAADEIERLRAEVTDLRCSVIAFGAPAMVEYARDQGLPKGHLYPSHYDILKRAGARMVSFTRADEADTQ